MFRSVTLNVVWCWVIYVLGYFAEAKDLSRAAQVRFDEIH